MSHISYMYYTCMICIYIYIVYYVYCIYHILYIIFLKCRCICHIYVYIYIYSTYHIFYIYIYMHIYIYVNIRSRCFANPATAPSSWPAARIPCLMCSFAPAADAMSTGTSSTADLENWRLLTGWLLERWSSYQELSVRVPGETILGPLPLFEIIMHALAVSCSRTLALCRSGAHQKYAGAAGKDRTRREAAFECFSWFQTEPPKMQNILVLGDLSHSGKNRLQDFRSPRMASYMKNIYKTTVWNDPGNRKKYILHTRPCKDSAVRQKHVGCDREWT